MSIKGEQGMIIVAEDDDGDFQMIIGALRDAQVDCIMRQAKDGKELLASLGALRPTGLRGGTIVLLDLKLPGIDGWEALKRIRSSPQTKGLPVIVLTGSKQAEDVQKAYELGANSYIKKPLDAKKLTSLVNYWFHTSELPG